MFLQFVILKLISETCLVIIDILFLYGRGEKRKKKGENHGNHISYVLAAYLWYCTVTDFCNSKFYWFLVIDI